ncbi:MAG: hypothetical protein QXQ66_08580 [Candidatus Hadarchaeum sp.]
MLRVYPSHTLTAVDMGIRWCDLTVLPNYSQHAVGETIDIIYWRLLLLLDLDFGNASDFLNGNLAWYCVA